MECSSNESFHERSMSLPLYTLYRRRFYVLFIFSFLAFNQCLFWITFAPISESTQQYYNITEGTVDLLLAWGPISFIPCLPLTFILLNRPNGLKYCVRILAVVCLLSTTVRIIPSILISLLPDSNKGSLSLPFLHAGQILNAICGPLAMAPVSQLSSLWFNTNERTRATTVAIMAYNLGSTTGFVIGPEVVYSPSKIANLLYIHVGLAFVACLLTLIYFPGEPPTPPTPAAQLLISSGKNKENSKSWNSYLKDLLNCFKNRSFVLLVCAGGLIGGTYGTWTALFDSILTDENYSEKQAGWFGFCSNIAEITGGLILSFLADMPRFNRSFKIMIIVSYICYFINLLWFNLSIKTIFSNKSILPSNSITIGISVTLAGLFQGAASPLTYESLAEFMYPLPESLSASILVEFINITSLTLLFIAPDRSPLMNFIILIIVCLCISLISLTKFNYKRRDADRIKRHTLVPDDDPLYDSNQLHSTENSSITDSGSGAIQLDSLPNQSFENPLFHQSNT